MVNEGTAPKPHRVSVPDLIVVMPVYNEAEIVATVVSEWLRTLDALEISYRLNIRDDGSADNTAAVLDQLSHPSLEVVHARNRGHGPAILRAYRAAAERSPWVFQTDSDGELPAASFPAFWEQRQRHDMVVGIRTGRRGPWSRHAVTLVLRWMTRLLFGPGVADANCPYRLLRTGAFRPLFDQLPEDTFAPNVLISGYSLRRRLRIGQLEVPHTPRATGACSIRKGKLLKAALRSARQTLAFRFRNPAGKVRR